MVIEFWIEQETKNFEAICFSATRKINSSKTMKEVKLATQVNPNYAIKYLQNNIYGYKQMCRAAENKMNQIGEEQLKKLENMETKNEFIEQFSKLKSNDWQHLRGEYAHLYRKFEKQAESLLFKKFSN